MDATEDHRIEQKDFQRTCGLLRWKADRDGLAVLRATDVDVRPDLGQGNLLLWLTAQQQKLIVFTINKTGS